MPWSEFAATFAVPPAKKKDSGCPHGKRMKKLIKDTRERGQTLSDPDEALAGLELIDAGMAYCIARCGGCELTKDWTPPA